MSSRRTKTLLGIAAVVVVLSAWTAADWWISLPPGRTATFVGRDSCATCHERQTERWTGSDHDRAMDPATPEFVLGDFNNTQLEHHGVTSRMSQRGDDFFVETEGPDGRISEFQVRYVFGYRPLQQYLAELDRGHIQVLPVTWDTEAKVWYYANPDPPFGPEDPLHWTGSAQNWNHMCADCHTTNFAKNFDVASDTYHSTWSEIDVSCEACHGPGSIHVELAQSRSLFWDRNYGYGLPDLGQRQSSVQLETCAPCHSHRQPLQTAFQAGKRFFDHFGLSHLEDHLYYPDGQINEEVYVYGSFNQSLMYRKGIVCTDCHDPHTTRIRFEGNRLCTQCHLPAKYDTPGHHHHKSESTGAKCVECHMPETTYMGVDARRDHSLRIPRPDLTSTIGSPNACTGCHDHADKTAEWAAAAVEEWFGPKRRDDPHYGEILFAGRQADPAAATNLAELARSRNVGPIVQATAVSLLGTRYPVSAGAETIERALTHREPQVRAAAVATLAARPINSRQDVDQLFSLLVPKLTDRSRYVRVEAARVASAFPDELFDRTARQARTKAIKEYRDSLLLNADQAGAHVSLGMLAANSGDAQGAVDAYRTAIRLDPAISGPRSNLAQLLSDLGQPDEARRLREEEAELLARDAALLPDNPGLQYRLGLLHYLLGREQDAEAAFQNAIRLVPRSAEFQLALTLLYEKQQRWNDAQQAADRLVQLEPDNAMYRQVRENIRQATAK